MSSSDPKSYISLTETPKEARKKIMGAKTGGRATAEEQKELGGTPEQCMIYELFVYHLVEDDNELHKIYHECKSGALRCGDCKMKCAELMEKFLIEHQKKRENAKNRVDNILGN
jgi:tryptophanyl-tRNA synthetase